MIATNGQQLIPTTTDTTATLTNSIPDNDVTSTNTEQDNTDVIEAIANASVKKLNGNKNELTITITETLANGNTNTITEIFLINNNAADTYTVGSYNVYVDTKGNTQIRACYIVHSTPQHKHVKSTKTVVASCTEDGYVKVTCSVCDEELRECY